MAFLLIDCPSNRPPSIIYPNSVVPPLSFFNQQVMIVLAKINRVNESIFAADHTHAGVSVSVRRLGENAFTVPSLALTLETTAYSLSETDL